jgi:hypothetical protein
MKSYTTPKIEICFLDLVDIITTSNTDNPEELPIQPFEEGKFIF